MNWIIYPFIAIVTFCIMEGVTWCTHKYVMHGFLWYLHEDHHKPQKKIFEKNDAFFFIFAIPSWLFIMLGSRHQSWWIVCVGSGIALYGLAYFLVHDVIIHRRLKWFGKSNNRYVRALRLAHKMHHKHLGKEKGESFGLLFVGKQYWEKAEPVRKNKKKIPGKHVA